MTDSSNSIWKITRFIHDFFYNLLSQVDVNPSHVLKEYRGAKSVTKILVKTGLGFKAAQLNIQIRSGVVERFSHVDCNALGRLKSILYYRVFAIKVNRKQLYGSTNSAPSFQRQIIHSSEHSAVARIQFCSASVDSFSAELQSLAK